MTQETGEKKERPFGDLVVENGIADKATVERALEKQRGEARRGIFRRLGEVLIDSGDLDPKSVQKLLALQGKTILVCPTCIAQYNVDGFGPGKVALCERCHFALTVPERLDQVKVEDEILARSASGRLALEQVSRDAEEKGPLAAIRAARKFGNFEVLGEISRGGMGIVYKARQPGLDRVVALKVIQTGEATAEDTERFKREARAVSRLRHPNIVAVHDVGEIDGVNYFSMDFIEGLTLDQAVTTEGLSHREVAEIFVKICDAVAYAHRLGVIHRDLKPKNIIVDKRREPAVIDFGIARMNELDGEAGTLTKSGEILGSPAYLAPEYLAGTVLDYDATCDVWSIGACLYHALAGRAPHAAEDTMKIIRNASSLEVPPIRTIARTVDRDLATIVTTACERERQNRYRSAEELGHDLRRYLDGEEIAARSSALTKWWRRVRLKVAAGLGLLVSFVLVGMSGYYASRIRGLEQLKGESDVSEAESARLRVQYVELLEAHAQLLFEKGQVAEAERAVSEAIRRAPQRSALYELRARARRLLGRTQEALEDERLAKATATKENK